MQNQDRSRRLEELFAIGSELGSDEIDAFVRRHCADDEALRGELVRMLELAAEVPDGFLAEPAPQLPSGLRRRTSTTRHLAAGRPEPGSGPPTDPAAESPHELLGRLARRTGGGDRYEERGEIARGGMGTVSEVWDRDLRRPLAMKRALTDAEPRDGAGDLDARALGRFLEEAQVTGQLDHPGIVPVHELGIDADGRAFFTMRLVRGKTLARVFDLARERREGWSTARVLEVLIKLCDTVAYAHSKRVIHRDLKPVNVMVGDFGEVYVMDWGLAKLIDNGAPQPRPTTDTTRAPIVTHRADAVQQTPRSPFVTVDGTIVGTPTYMCPEQAHGRLALMDERSDVYSVGAMLYELLAGAAPYVGAGDGDSSDAILKRVRDGAPPSLPDVARDAPAELVAICEKAMARDRDARYANARVLAEELRAFLENRVVRAHRTGAYHELRKWVQRNRAIAVSTAVSFVLALGSLATGLVLALSAEHDARQERRRADEKVAEFQMLSGIVRLERANEAEAALRPAGPTTVDAMVRWLDDEATPLLALRERITAALAGLRAAALPWSDEERHHDRLSHPRLPELDVLARKRDVLRSARDVRAGGAPPVIPAPDPLRLTVGASSINWFTSHLVDPDRPDELFGREAESVGLVRAVLDAAPADDLPGLYKRLIEGYFALGLDDLARAALRAVTPLVPDRLDEVIAGRAELEAAIAAARGDEGRRAIEALDAAIDALEREVSARRTYRFVAPGDQFLHDALTALARDLDTFRSERVAAVEARIVAARRLAEHAVRDDVAARWSEAREHLALADDVHASARYREIPIDLVPQLDLVPIGMNPATKLWEFHHLPSAGDPDGLPAYPGDGSGIVTVDEGKGIVFVLVPGGEYRIGGQDSDPGAPHYDPRFQTDESLHVVRLDPYFIARHELTQAQWFRLSQGAEFGLPAPDSPTRPQNLLDWSSCDRLARRAGLRLPTEAQWEVACRAGTTTVWYCGDDAGDLGDHANLSGSSGLDQWHWPYHVGRLRPNAFGLHDVYGNVWEWCQDRYHLYAERTRSGDGLALVDRVSRDLNPGPNRVARGGSCTSSTTSARSARRAGYPPVIVEQMGFRPARALVVDEFRLEPR